MPDLLLLAVNDLHIGQTPARKFPEDKPALIFQFSCDFRVISPASETRRQAI